MKNPIRDFNRLKYQFGQMMNDIDFDGYIRISGDTYIITIYQGQIGDTANDTPPIYITTTPKFKTPNEIFQHIKDQAPEIFL